MPTDHERECRITARPGTPEYQRQFNQQALAAADAALRMWTVRVPCGLFAVMSVCLAFSFAAHFRQSPLEHGLMVIELLTVALETGSVALRGKSLYFRWLLSGVRREAESGSHRDEPVDG
jgi:hypothetical protein